MPDTDLRRLDLIRCRLPFAQGHERHRRRDLDRETRWNRSCSEAIQGTLALARTCCCAAGDIPMASALLLAEP